MVLPLFAAGEDVLRILGTLFTLLILFLAPILNAYREAKIKRQQAAEEEARNRELAKRVNRPSPAAPRKRPRPAVESVTAVSDEGPQRSLATLNTSLPSKSVFAGSEPLGEAGKFNELSGLSADALPSEIDESIYGDAAMAMEAEAARSGLAGEIVRMLTHPESIRQAVILSEILHRPYDFDKR